MKIVRVRTGGTDIVAIEPGGGMLSNGNIYGFIPLVRENVINAH